MKRVQDAVQRSGCGVIKLMIDDEGSRVHSAPLNVSVPQVALGDQKRSGFTMVSLPSGRHLAVGMSVHEEP